MRRPAFPCPLAPGGGGEVRRGFWLPATAGSFGWSGDLIFVFKRNDVLKWACHDYGQRLVTHWYH
jgi:hypothetical protein